MKKTLLISTAIVMAIPAMAQKGYVKDKVEDKYEEKYGEPGKDKYNDWMQGKVLNAKVQPEYDFPLGMVMVATTYKKGEKKDATDVHYFINPAKSYFATSTTDKKGKSEMLMIYDMKANSMLMLDTKKMTGMAISLNAFMSGKAIAEREKKLENETPSETNKDCKKIGKTKTIQGYVCDGYECIDSEKNTRTEMWLTNKIPISIAQANMRGPFAHYFKNVGKMTGMLMEASYYKNDVIESSIIVTEVNPAANRKEVMKNYQLN